MVSSDDVPQESVIQYTVDIPEALPPNLHGEGAHTLYCCTVMAERPHALARRTISWCAPLRLVAAPPRRRCRGSLPANSPPRQIHKRYSQFHDLRCSLVELLSDRSSKTKRAKKQREHQQDMADAVKLLPELPPKIWVGNNFARGTVEDRRLKLRSFLLALVALPNAAQLELVRDFLGQPDEVLMPTSEDVARPALAPGLSSPGTWRAQAQRGWRLRGCRDDLYNGVYHLCKDEAGANRMGATHCVNGQGKHLYVGPTGKWYINNRFSTGDECKAFYHRRRQDRRLSVPEPAALPLGAHPWQYWDRDRWVELTIQLQPVPESEAASSPPEPRPEPEPEPEPEPPVPAQVEAAATAANGAPAAVGPGAASPGRFEQWLSDSRSAALPSEGLNSLSETAPSPGDSPHRR